MLGEKEIKENNASSNLKAIKTYRDFAVNSLKSSSTSLAKMIIKEKKKQEVKQFREVEEKKNGLMVALSIFLVILGVAAVVGVYFYSLQQNQGGNGRGRELEVKSLIPFDYKKEINLMDMNQRKINKVFRSLIDETKIPIGDVKILYFTTKKNQVLELASARDFITTLDTRIPIQLERTLYKTFTTGVVSIDSNLPFFIFKVHSFDTAYVKMREWEKTILFDLGSLFKIDKRFYSQQFVDLDLYNEDARVILDEEGKIVFGYSFININTLLFFTSSETFKHVQGELRSYQERK